MEQLQKKGQTKGVVKMVEGLVCFQNLCTSLLVRAEGQLNGPRWPISKFKSAIEQAILSRTGADMNPSYLTKTIEISLI